MSDTDAQVPLPDLNAADTPGIDDVAYHDDEQASRIAADLEAVFDVPVQVSAVLGRARMDVGELLNLAPIRLWTANAPHAAAKKLCRIVIRLGLHVLTECQRHRTA